MDRQVLADQDNEVKPFLFQWDDSKQNWKEKEKLYKHDTIGLQKVEYPLWITVCELEDELSQYLIALTEEGF